MSPDPKLATARHLANPQKWNKYAYVRNNPLAFLDPDGLDDWYVFRPLVPKGTALSKQWGAAVKAAGKRGDTVHMLQGTDASTAAYNSAIAQKGAHVEVISHAGSGGVALSDGISNGQAGSDSSNRTGNTLNIAATTSVDVQARDVAVIGCRSIDQAGNYTNTNFTRVDPGPSDVITTDVGSAIGAELLSNGTGQTGIDASSNAILQSQDPRNDGARVESIPAQSPPPPPEQSKELIPEVR